MSYFSTGGADFEPDGSINPNINASYAFLATVMPADILAMRTLYGSNFATRAGDTTYGNNSNVTGYLGQLMDQAVGGAAAQDRIYIGNPISLTIFDTGGTDTLDCNGTSAAQTISLTAGAISNVFGAIGNLQIARGVVIENAIGGGGNDRLTGNAGRDTLTRGSGNDTLLGGGWGDRLDGGAGNDVLTGGATTDSFVFAAGADVVTDFVNSVDTIVLQDGLWGAGLTIANVLAEFAIDTASDVLLCFANGETLRIVGLAFIGALANDMSFF